MRLLLLRQSDNRNSVELQQTIQELRTVNAFSGLSDAQLHWFIEHADAMSFNQGDYLSHAGDPAVYLLAVLEGTFQVRQEHGDGPVLTFTAGDVTGFLPFSRMKTYPMPVRAVSPTVRVLRMHKQQFPALYQELPELIPKLVGILTDRVREIALRNNQTEKLAAIGKLSAGLAHELNNPAAAARQATASARKLFDCYRQTVDKMAVQCTSTELYEAVRSLETRATAAVETPRVINSLIRSDLEESITTWLDSIQAPESWRIAPAFIDAGFDARSLALATSGWPSEFRALALNRIASSIEMSQVLAQLSNSTHRIGDLIAAMKTYSFMDRSAIAEFDLNQNLEATLTMFSFRFKQGIELVKSYDTTLPPISANGGQLNQVWTNLIDNALDAMEELGHRDHPSVLTITTRQEMDDAIVEIADNGPGIPVDVQARVFEPFFTTKPQGEGTGIGLDTVYRIVKQHHGEVQLRSSASGTTFKVRLPIRAKS